jgi:hypothetical protein
MGAVLRARTHAGKQVPHAGTHLVQIRRGPVRVAGDFRADRHLDLCSRLERHTGHADVSVLFDKGSGFMRVHRGCSFASVVYSSRKLLDKQWESLDGALVAK